MARWHIRAVKRLYEANFHCEGQLRCGKRELFYVIVQFLPRGSFRMEVCFNAYEWPQTLLKSNFLHVNPAKTCSLTFSTSEQTELCNLPGFIYAVWQTVFERGIAEYKKKTHKLFIPPPPPGTIIHIRSMKTLGFQQMREIESSIIVNRKSGHLGRF